ncbi:29591_t:CDS:2 [Gigaspora margarita]|uniref:Aurora kinase n=1 Tax=Gigaspora margarita TaxID=4874 RepID=A0ABN7UF88_GIGMA|nr:29591_t:CDS:2 [Gigaspora margarita]
MDSIISNSIFVTENHDKYYQVEIYNESKNNEEYQKEITISQPIRVPQMLLKSFYIGRGIGKGQFGSVFIAREKISGYIVALKLLSIGELVKENAKRQLRHEVEIQMNLRHPNILRLLGYFQDDKYFVLILEYAFKRELYKQLVKLDRLKKKKASRYIAQTTSALSYIHQKHVIHRDIKPENLLIDLNDEIKIADFGLSVQTIQRRKTFCGTLHYLLLEMIEGTAPFEETGHIATYKQIAKVEFTLPGHLSFEACNLICSLLQRDPKQRLPLKDILKHPWIQKYQKTPVNIISFYSYVKITLLH